MEHRRHLEEYSIRTGDAISVQSQLAGSWASHLNYNGGFIPDEGPNDTSSIKDLEPGYVNNVVYVNEMHSEHHGIQNKGYVTNFTQVGTTSTASQPGHKDMLNFL